MRAAQRAFRERRKDDATKSVGEHMSTSQAFSFLKFYQHVFFFFAKLPHSSATMRQRIKLLKNFMFCLQVAEYGCNFATWKRLQYIYVR